MRHAEDNLGDPGVGGSVEHGVDERDRRLGSLEAEALLADVAQVEERLEGLGGVQLAEDVPLLLGRQHLRGPLDVVLDPELLLGTLDVHVLHADRTAVGVAQDLEDLRERKDLAPRQAEGVEAPLKVVGAEPVAPGVEVRAELRGTLLEGIEPRDQVAAHPVHVDERPDHQLLPQLIPVAGGRHASLGPADRFTAETQRGEDLVVEAVPAHEELVDAPQKQPRLGPLDDPVVVGRRQRDDGADAEGAQRLGRRRLELDRIVEHADPDDRALAAHQPRQRLGRPERPRVRDRDGAAAQIVDDELAGPRPVDEILVGGAEPGEVERVGTLDHRDDERARTVGSRKVDGESQPDVGVADDPGRPRPVGVVDVARVQRRDLADGPDDGPPDEVGEADLEFVPLAQLLVDEGPVGLQHPRRDRVHARRRRHGQARDHVLGDPAAARP